jgi:hypothetical protein
MRRLLVPMLLPVLVCVLLAGCGSPRMSGDGAAYGAAYVGGSVTLECAPFARVLSGVALRGPADTWWSAADGRYARGHDPVVGGVLVFRRSVRLPSGHVAVVARVVEPRRILVAQANWVHHRVTEDQIVVDVSRDNDWSLVRVFWPPSGQMGSAEYPTYGFIRPERPASPEQIAQATPKAVRIASQE